MGPESLGHWDLGFAASGRRSTAVMVGDGEPEVLDFRECL